ncbi:MAG: hypothetical protein CBC35_09800 [Planctomycetes bacterium TMED75]|nr:MAG: hypothetical protein CBC35_09800 [Planctomycetes bacterium TMED75]
MTSSMTVHLHVMDLGDAKHRAHALQLLEGDTVGSIHQVDGSSLHRDTLLSALNAFTDENELTELSLDELAGLSGGVGLPEALVSSTILMAMVASASGVFSNSMSAVNQSQIQDSLNAGVNANIEEVRNDLASQFLNSSTGQYAPTTSDLGADFLTTMTDEDSAQDGVQTLLNVGGQQVQRTITADGHTIEISYTHVAEAEQISSTTMISPAAGWLP